MHNTISPTVIFNSARLVRKGEELEHCCPEPSETTRGEGGSRHEASGQLTTQAA
jgi:hypothetical protein